MEHFGQRSGWGWSGDTHAGRNRAGLEALAGSRPIVLRQVSLGASQSYARHRGVRVLDDHGTAATELTERGQDLSVRPEAVRPLVGAFVRGPGAPSVRAWITCTGDQFGGYLRARCGTEPRTPWTRVAFGGAQAADVELELVHVETASVRTITEKWTWEWSETAGGECQSLGPAAAAAPVRIYVTAGAPINGAPCESYYHVACAVAGATNAAEARRDVWRHFRGFHQGRSITNARGQALTFWCDESPAMGESPYMARGARDLVTRADASCRGWAELLHEALAIHGIAARVKNIQPGRHALAARYRLPKVMVPDKAGRMAPVIGLGLLVRPYRWETTPSAAGRHDTGEPIDFGDFTWKLDNPVSLFGSEWAAADVHDLGRPTPALQDSRIKCNGAFGNHAVVLVMEAGRSEAWYDPSFGLGPFPSLAAYEHELLGKGRPDCGGIFAVVGCRYLYEGDTLGGSRRAVDVASVHLAAMPAPPEPVLEALDV